jgi:hypothetical protein
MMRINWKTKVSVQDNKKGSSTVFLVMVLSSMILLTVAFIQVVIRISGESTGQSVALLSGRSVLSEYDRNLKNEYGIFAFRGAPGVLAAKMDYYESPFFNENPYFRLGDTTVDTSAHRLTNPLVFQNAITEYVLYAKSEAFLNQVLEKNSESKGEEPKIPVYPTGRVLRNEQIIDGLPSFALGEEPSLLDTVKSGLTNWKDVFQNTSKAFLVNQYIMMVFKNAQKDIPDRNTFFNYEVEYILKGNYDDQKNKSIFRRDLLLLRNMINLETIYTDNQLRAQVLAAANIVSPGPGSLATQILIAEAWALAEAENDVRILEHGKKLPLQKTSATWAIDIQSIIEGTKSGYIDTKVNRGLDYQGYLQLFLYFENNTVKLTRMMDLMQINIQGNYDKTFLMSEHQVGMAYETEINYFTVRGETEY